MNIIRQTSSENQLIQCQLDCFLTPGNEFILKCIHLKYAKWVESDDEIFKCHHSNESYRAHFPVALFIIYAVRGGSKF